ncbi:type IV pili twitching motility protein PilT, partial [Microcoleus sp. herbarium8]
MNPSNNRTPVRPEPQARRTPPPPPPLAIATPAPSPAAPSPPPAAPPRAVETPTSTIEQMVRDAHSASASDIHIRVGQVPRFRIRG